MNRASVSLRDSLKIFARFLLYNITKMVYVGKGIIGSGLVGGVWGG